MDLSWRWFTWRWFRVRNRFRRVKWGYQRATRGYSDCDWWNANGFLAQTIASICREIREHHHGIPGEIATNHDDINDASEEWSYILTTIEEGFTAAVKMYDCDFDPNETSELELEAQFDRGMELFAKWFHSLWD